MKLMSIIGAATLAALLFGCVAPQEHAQRSDGLKPSAKPTFMDVTTYPYDFNSPITGYQNPKMGASRTLRIGKLGTLGKTTNIFFAGDTYTSSTELVLGGNLRIPAKIEVRSSKSAKNATVLGYKVGSYECLFRLSPMGEDENKFRYYKPILRQRDMMVCNTDWIIRIEQRSEGVLRVSAQNTTTGVEQWAGIFHKKEAQ